MTALPFEHLLQGQWRIDDVIGQNDYVITYETTHDLTSQKAIVKEFFPRNIANRAGTDVQPTDSQHESTFNDNLKRFSNESQKLAGIRHENVVRVFNCFEESGTAYVVIELLKGENLTQKLSSQGKLEQATIDSFLSPITKGLAAIHGIYCLHLDITPDRIFFKREHKTPILLSSGVVDQKNQIEKPIRNISPGFSPPEIYSSDDDNKDEFNQSSDIYSFAAVLYYSVTGEAPPDAEKRVKACAEEGSDSLSPAYTVERVTRGYRQNFLQSIDVALALDIKTRPEDLFQWLQSLLRKDSAEDAEDSAEEVANKGKLWIDLIISDGSPEVQLLLDGMPFTSGDKVIYGFHELQIDTHGFHSVNRKILVQEAEFRVSIELQRKRDLKLNETLSKAASAGDSQKVEEMIEAGADVNFIDKEGDTALIRASQGESYDIVFMLLQAEANPNIQGKHKRSALMTASDGGFDFIVETLIKGGADGNLADESGLTPLMIACVQGYEKIVSILLEAEVDVEAKMDDGATALMAACLSGNQDIIKILLQKNVNINAVDIENRTALIMAAIQGHAELISILLDANAQTDIVSNEGKNAFDYALDLNKLEAILLLKAVDKFLSAAIDANTHLLSELIEVGVDINSRNEAGQSALMLASKYGQLEVVRFLLAKGATVAGKCNANMTALDYAVRESYTEISVLLGGQEQLVDAAATGQIDKVERLLSIGVDVNARNSKDRTALMAASQRNNVDVIDVLLQSNVALNVQREEDGMTALMIAVNQEQRETVQKLLGAGAAMDIVNAEGTALIQACKHTNTEIITNLLEAGDNVDVQREQDGCTPLMIASTEGSISVAKTLLQYKADPNVRDNAGRTPLMHSCLANQIAIIPVLLSAKANINSKNNAGRTALIISVMQHHDEFSTQLLKAKSRKRIDVNVIDNEGRTALIYACLYNQIAVVAELLKLGTRIRGGTKVDIRDNDGQTSLMYACILRYTQVVKQLIHAGANIYAKDNNGWTPLMLASKNGDMGLAKLLLGKSTASLFRRNSEGYTARDIATQYGHNGLAVLMLWAPIITLLQPLLKLRMTAFIPKFILPGNVLLLAREIIGGDVNDANNLDYKNNDAEQLSTINAIESAPVRLWVDIKPNVGWLRVDGKLFKDGDWLPGGEHELCIESEGFSSDLRKIKTEGKSSHLRVELLPPKVGDSFRDNPLSPEMVVVPPGEFSFKTPSEQEQQEQNMHIGYHLAVAKYPITCAEYATFVKETSYSSGFDTRVYESNEWVWRQDRNWQNPGFEQTGQHPVVCVSWHDTQVYIQWLKIKTGYDYRLPSVDEWQSLASAEYDINGHEPPTAEYSGTVKVGTSQANAFGIHDMSGNIIEWEQDCDDNIRIQDNPEDVAPGHDDCARRVHCGSSWVLKTMKNNLAMHSRDVAYTQRNNLGFRLVRTLNDALFEG